MPKRKPHGGARPGAGRPPKPKGDLRDQVITSITKAEKDFLLTQLDSYRNNSSEPNDSEWCE